MSERVSPSLPGPDALHPILVVDDDPQVLTTIRQALEDQGLEVEAAPDGWAALEAAARRRPALVVLDWHLPRLGARDVAAGLRAAYPASVPILLISGDAQACADAWRIRAYSYLNKPLDLDELLLAVLTGLGAP